jgi:hypothetical protein
MRKRKKPQWRYGVDEDALAFLKQDIQALVMLG